MNLFDLKNNAMFLACWHERNRPLQIGSFCTLIGGILCLSFLNISINVHHPKEVWKSFFYVLTFIQALVLLLEGTLMTAHLAGRERTFETLDFHRNSPQPVLEKIFGLVFGAAWFEWLVFLVFFIAQLPFAVLPDFPTQNILLYNLSLLMTGIFFHTTAATLPLISASKKRGLPFILIIIVLFFIFSFISKGLFSPHPGFWSFFFGTIAIKFINPQFAAKMHGYFYSLDLPTILLQAFVQIPLVLMMVRGMIRVFNKPSSPAWSKKDLIRITFFIFFMITGFFVASTIHFDDIKSQLDYYSSYYVITDFIRDQYNQFALLYSVLGFALAIWTVPSYFKRTKYLILAPQKTTRLWGLFDDGASSLPTMALYLLVGFMFLAVYFFHLHFNPQQCLATMIMFSAHVLAFAGFLEYFRLGRFRNNLAFFLTTCVIWWVFIPVLAEIIFQYPRYNNQAIYLASVSPFMGIIYVMSFTYSINVFSWISVMGPIWIMAGIWILTWQVHAQLRLKINSHLKKTGDSHGSDSHPS